ncbi:MAG TPA: hypothetical protein VH041_11440, partial [Caldimonas sp.]
MDAKLFFMTGSGGSRARSSSYEKGPRDAGAERAAWSDAGGRGGPSRAALARLATAALIAASALVAGCGTLATNVGKTDSLA